MAARLEQLGRACVRHRVTVIVVWAIALAAVLLASHALRLRTSSEPALPGTQSQAARAVIEREVRLPVGADGRVVYGVESGRVTDRGIGRRSRRRWRVSARCRTSRP